VLDLAKKFKTQLKNKMNMGSIVLFGVFGFGFFVAIGVAVVVWAIDWTNSRKLTDSQSNGNIAIEETPLTAAIRDEYAQTRAEELTVQQVLANITARQGNTSFDIANAVRLPSNTTKQSLRKKFGIGLGLAAKNPQWAAASDAEINAKNIVELIFIQEKNIAKLNELIHKAHKHNSHNSDSKMVIGVVVDYDGSDGFLTRLRQEMGLLGSSVPVRVVHEREIEFENEKISYTRLFHEFANQFGTDGHGRWVTVFTELANDITSEKQVVLNGASRMPYFWGTKLIDIMFIPVQGVLQNLKTILEAAKHA